ncbi:hypothetical protein [Granulicella sp. dw_53]|uniref:hypothetical protein n=1 Tax=Granulicella sp. dw_53 TaxID=2719792 RepID=UPI001BD67567|nr:hypothetical protein [Granulicella sp. dw_53]
MMQPSRLLVATFLAVFGAVSSPAQTFETLKGNCAIAVSTSSDRFEVRLERGTCPKEAEDRSNRDARRDCHTDEMQQPFESFSGFVVTDLGRDGAHINAVLTAEAGTLTCSGSIHNFKLSGDLTFTPNAAFATRLLKLGIQGITSQNLQTYALFHVQGGAIEALQKEGVSDIDAKNLASLSIFHVDVPFVQSIRALGYPTPSAKKLVELKIHGVNPEEVRQIRAMGYDPTLEELVKMRIFKVTPEFIQAMKSRGFGSSPQDLTIARLVKIRIFKLAE